MSASRTVVGSGATALAAALFATHNGTVDLYARMPPKRARSVESIPAAALNLLLELGVTPEELDVEGLSRPRLVAWEDSEILPVEGPACAHIDTAALHDAMTRRAMRHPAIRVQSPSGMPAPPAGWVDATGRRAVSARGHRRPPRTWTAALATVPAIGTGELRLAAAHDGYAYRLGSARWTTIGWVAPGRPPLTGAELCARIQSQDAAWILDGIHIPDNQGTFRRPASAAVPESAGTAVPLGDAALARDALASQGVSIGLSDARLIAHPTMAADAMARRHQQAIGRHFHHLTDMVSRGRFAHAPSWSEYLAWICRERDRCMSQPSASPTDTTQVGR
jgi:hypothetical protein